MLSYCIKCHAPCRYRRHERDIPNKICEQVMPILVRLGQQLLAASPAPSAPESTGHLLHLIAKAYKISIVADLSPHQASQESIVQWGTFLLQIVCRVIPIEAQPEDKDDRERWSWWKAKKWAHHVVWNLKADGVWKEELMIASFLRIAQSLIQHIWITNAAAKQ